MSMCMSQSFKQYPYELLQKQEVMRQLTQQVISDTKNFIQTHLNTSLGKKLYYSKKDILF